MSYKPFIEGIKPGDKFIAYDTKYGSWHFNATVTRVGDVITATAVNDDTTRTMTFSLLGNGTGYARGYKITPVRLFDDLERTGEAYSSAQIELLT